MPARVVLYRRPNESRRDVAIPGPDARQFPYLHFLRANRARRTAALRCRDPRAIPTCAPSDDRRASKWRKRIYILSRLCRRWRERGRKRERDDEREIYSRELSGTVQFSWIVRRGMRYCPTSPGLPGYFLFISSTDCSTGCFSLFSRKLWIISRDKAGKMISYRIITTKTSQI